MTFSVLASGGGLSYQWRFNGINLGNATNSTLVISNVTSGNVGAYSVQIVNTFAPTISANAYLVITSPTITQQPQSRTNYTGTTATFSVVASGDAPLSYQWRKNGGNLTIATNSSLVLNAVQLSDAGNYDVVVSNPAGSATSSVATLRAVVPLQIQQQPTNVTINAGSNVVFSVSATGTGTLRYQWLFNGNGITNNPSATNASLSLTNVQLANNGSYAVTVSDDVSSITSSNASLVVKVRPAITQQPASLTLAAGATANFSISATGTFPLGYRWRKGSTYFPDAIGLFSLNSNTCFFSLTNVQASDAASYNVAITNVAGAPAAGLSANAYLTVVTPPADQTAAAGSNVTFAANATSAALLQFRWQFNGSDISGATNTTLTLTNVQSGNAGIYSVVVTVVNVTVPPATFSATLTIPSPTLLSQPQFLANGSFQLRLEGTPNRSYFIDISSNMTSWSNLTTLAYTNGQMPFTDATTTNSAQRFYRARLAP